MDSLSPIKVPSIIGKNISLPIVTPKKVRNSYDRFKLLQGKKEDNVCDYSRNESCIGSMKQSIEPLSPKYCGFSEQTSILEVSNYNP